MIHIYIFFFLVLKCFKSEKNLLISVSLGRERTNVVIIKIFVFCFLYFSNRNETSDEGQTRGAGSSDPWCPESLHPDKGRETH